MKKILFMFREMLAMIRKHKLYFLAPILLVIVLLACLALYIGPSVLISFIYAGI